MNRELDRRRLLHLGSAAAITMIAGCTGGSDGDGADDLTLNGDDDDDEQATDGSEEADSSDTVDSEWGTFRGDTARTGRVPEGGGPGASLSTAWELTRADLLEELEGIDTETLSMPIMTNAWSWPVLAGERVCWTVGLQWTDPETDDRTNDLWVVAADVATGELEWAVRLEETADRVQDAWFAPEVSGGRLYVPVLAADGVAIAVYDPADGTELGRLDLGRSSVMSHPTVVDGVVYVADDADDGTLYAIDADDGAERWSVSTAMRPASWNTVSVDDETLWYAADDLVARDVTDGTERHRVTLDTPDSLVTDRPTRLAPPTIAEDGIYAAGNLETVMNRDIPSIAAVDADEGTERWQYVPPGIDGEDNYFLPPDPDLSPEEIEALPPLSAVYGYPIAADGRVLATAIGDFDASEDGHALIALDESGALEWAVELESVAYAPVAAGQVVYVPTSGGVEAISMTGEHLETVSIDQVRLEYPPALGGGRLFVPAMDRLVALE